MSDSNIEDRRTVQAIVNDDPNSWETVWSQNLKPWDGGGVQPPLRDLIDSGQLDLPDNGQALVPGCGTGYDVVFLASALRGFQVLGLDVSPTGLEAARRYSESQAVEDHEKRVDFQACDFFKFSVPDDKKFDLIYDHTFFVAIPPSMRLSWGKQMQNLVKPGGYLITLVYPLGHRSEEDKPKGPPFYVEPEHYIEPLGNGWEKVIDEIPERSSPNHEGKQRLVVWKRT
ncbi:hypothetical protein D9758_002566 [Tetrapyrgos nigripes]|uniref:Thiol methyltransferase 1 n=1 Tax=Tetrapyrgos nigripes TaxID=182062 RepID=A0A8H5GQX3_9AGAR|nr:hypothetical protein D9758_002566 [Tetrapyrgos nigripes]